MNINWQDSLLYGLVSGLTEFLPVSSQAHGALFRKLLGISGNIAVLQLLMHLAALLALYTATSGYLRGLHREMKLAAVPRRRRKRYPDIRSILDVQLIRTAFYPLVLGFFFYPLARNHLEKLYMAAVFLMLNGCILLIPQLLPTGNKDSRSMTRLDGVLMGLGSALAVIPGVSRMATTTTVLSARGADRSQALNWALLLSIPALAFYVGFDVYDIAVSGLAIASVRDVFVCVLGAAGTYCGAYGGILLMRFLAVNAGFSGFAYYSWGAALFTFIQFLTI